MQMQDPTGTKLCSLDVDETELMYLVENSGQISAESLEPIFQESFINEHTISISRQSPYVMNVAYSNILVAGLYGNWLRSCHVPTASLYSSRM